MSVATSQLNAHSTHQTEWMKKTCINQVVEIRFSRGDCNRDWLLSFFLQSYLFECLTKEDVAVERAKEVEAVAIVKARNELLDLDSNINRLYDRDRWWGRSRR